MKTEIADKWTTALRSGEYEQGRNYLASDGKFCCLGIACEIFADDAGLIKSVEPVEYKSVHTAFHFNGASTVLPTKAILYMEVANANPSILFGNMGLDLDSQVGHGDPDRVNTGISLAELNDGGFTFSQIADVIDYFKDDL